MARQIAKVGDVFWVSIDDGSYVLGQIVEIQKQALNSITCAFYNTRANEPENVSINDLTAISVQFVTKDLFNRGTWVRVSNSAVIIPLRYFPYRETQKNGWVGARIIGSGIIASFLSAFYGLRDWHEMKDPDYYKKLLLPGIGREKSP